MTKVDKRLNEFRIRAGQRYLELNFILIEKVKEAPMRA
jgi:hypothetical protein